MKRVVQKIQHLKNISQVIASGDHVVTVKNILNAFEKQTKEDLSYLEKNLLKIFPLFGLIKKSQKSQQKFYELISQLQIEYFQNNQVIFHKGDIGRKMYFVLSGHLLSFPYDYRDIVLFIENVYINNHTANKELNVGDHFGEISLQHRIPRTLTVVSKGEVILLSVNYESYSIYIQSTVDKILTDQYKFIKTLSIFQDWSEFTIQLILHHLKEEKIQRNQYVFNEGSKDQNLYIIKFGEIILQKQYTVNQKKSENGLICLSQGQCFGDFEFIDNQSWLQNKNSIKEISRQMDAKSTTESQILYLPFLTYLRIQEEYHSSTLQSFLSTSKQVVIQRMKMLQQQIINKKIKLDEESERKDELSELRMFKDQKQEEKQPQIVNDTSKIRHSNNPYISLMGTIKNNKNKEHQSQPSLQIDQIANQFSQKSILMKFDRGHKILLLKKLRDASILPDVKDNFIYQQQTVRSSCSRLRMKRKYQLNNQQDSVIVLNIIKISLQQSNLLLQQFVIKKKRKNNQQFNYNSRSHTPDCSVVLPNEFKAQNEINKCQRAFTFKLNDFHNFKVSQNSVGYSRSISQMSISRSIVLQNIIYFFNKKILNLNQKFTILQIKLKDVIVLIANHLVNINSKLNMKKINHNLHKNNLKLRLTYVFMGNNDLPKYISRNFEKYIYIILMVYFKLLFSCETKNVEAISTGGANYEWHISLVCSSCHTDINEIYFRGDDQVDVANSRGQCNFQMKCKSCAKMINISIEKFPDTVNVQEITKDIQIALFDCRGAEPKTWNFQGLTVITPNGTVFNDADLTDTWVEYDEKAAEEVLVDKFKAYFQKTK